MTQTLGGVGGVSDPVGAVWRRWEPHIHTPGTALSSKYGSSTIGDFIDAVDSSSPIVECLAVTDYCLTRKYEEIVAEKAKGRLPNVKLLFCNIELRYSIATKTNKSINFHLLVSPDDPNHVAEINRFLSSLTFRGAGGETYHCNESDLRRLGLSHDPSIIDDEKALQAGINQFKVDFNQLKDKFEDSAWMRANVLVAVAGSSNDGTAGLQSGDGAFTAQRRAIETFAHIIFSATPGSVQFWNGEGALSQAELEEQYNGPKPCLHGSDAHSLDKVCKPDNERRSWIKGDATFEALKQACLEPAGRAHIGPTPPDDQSAFAVRSVSTPTLDWLLPTPLQINAGMVAIIGARGSGKTALADLIAHGGNSPFPLEAPQSFISRASAHLGSAQVVSAWSDSSEKERPLNSAPSDPPDVHYLTQQFVDRLCSSESESDELLDEIKRVVFLAHAPEDRLGSENFDDLVEQRSSATKRAVADLTSQLDELSREIQVERNWFMQKSQISTDLNQARVELKRTEGQRQEAIKPGGQARAAYYTLLGAEISRRERILQEFDKKMQQFAKLETEIVRYSERIFPKLLGDLKDSFGATLLRDEEWAKFAISFTGDPRAIIDLHIKTLRKQVSTVAASKGARPKSTDSSPQLEECSLEALKLEHTAVGKEIGVDQRNLQRLQQLNNLHKTLDTKVRRLEASLARATDSGPRLDAVLAKRAVLYTKFFELIIEEVSILQSLYQPLESYLSETSSSANRLSLRVLRDVDVDGWSRHGESLLDLRKVGEFRGQGALALIARMDLQDAWERGSAEDVSSAIERFRQKYDGSLLSQSRYERTDEGFQDWIIELGRWLYSTEHVRVRYSIEYDGVPITQLSPGTRGIVLLLLYLALDLEDSRPLIIDQPEENLDPRSVFKELTSLFSEARLRRQVIIVTHNANLVVNTDVDQVIVASCTRPSEGAPPYFSYQSGGLEDPSIRSHVCEILEGGVDAFKQRARRLRMPINGDIA